MDWSKHGNKLVERLVEVGSGAVGAIAGHFITMKMTKDGAPVTIDGNPVKTLDMTQIRGHAPHFAKTMMDEAEFIAIKNDLDPGLRKSLESWMPTLGIHQRADIVLTLAEMTCRRDLAADDTPDRKDNRIKARVAAFKALKQLAEVPDAIDSNNPGRGIWGQKDAHAVAFKFMKTNETDYLGGQLSAGASKAIAAAWVEIQAAKTEWDIWMNDCATETDNWTRGMRAHLATRPRGFFPTLRRLFDLPWDRN